MRIGIDLSPLKKGNYLAHRVRGTGFYVENLKNSLEKFYAQNEYIYFSKGEKLPAELDAVHFPYFEPFFLTLPLSMPHNSVVTVHDLIPFVFPANFPSGLKGNLRWRIQKHSLQNSQAIITDSVASKKDIIKFTGIDKEKIHVVYLAAAPHFKKKANVPNKYNLPDKFALFVGDVTWNKNLPNLIEAISETEIPLVIVGKAFTQKDIDKNNPWTRDLAKAQSLAGKNPKIIPLGFVTDEDLVDLYNLASLFAMPSRYEGFGLPILEAMACGVPVVTSRRGSLEEVAGDAAYYVDPDDIKSIKEGILKVFNDSGLQKKLSEAGLKRSKKFSWDSTASQTLKVYEKVSGKSF